MSICRGHITAYGFGAPTLCTLQYCGCLTWYGLWVGLGNCVALNVYGVQYFLLHRCTVLVPREAVRTVHA